MLHQGSISFSAKASSEQGNSGTIYDYLTFYIDNEQMILIGGESDWGEYSFVVTPGEHTFRWTYEKDAAGSSGDDCAWIDNIIFPPGSIPPLNINFGDLNSDGTVNVLDFALKNNTPILLASSSEIYGDAKINPQAEDYFGNVNTVGPRSVYDESKRVAETLCYVYNKLYNIYIGIAHQKNKFDAMKFPGSKSTNPHTNSICEFARWQDCHLAILLTLAL